jgi:vacuolar-type H+-ATPase subunit H
MSVLSAAGDAWTHDALASDLARHLQADGLRYTWTNIALGGPSAPRPDVYTLKPFAFEDPETVSYEVKVSTADFRRDIVAGKWQAYLDFSQSVTFACPQGLLSPSDIPAQCGLIVRGAKAWRHLRRPVPHPMRAFPIKSALKLIAAQPYRVVHDRPSEDVPGVSSATRHHRVAPRRDDDAMYERAMRASVRRRLGDAVAHALAAPDEAERLLAEARAKAETIINFAKHQAERVPDEILSVQLLGLESDAEFWAISAAWREARSRTVAEGEARILATALLNLRSTINKTLAGLPDPSLAQLPDKPSGPRRRPA